MKTIICLLLCTFCSCLVLSSCGGGGGNRPKYSLSCNDFMAGRKFLLFSAQSCAFIIKPKDLQDDEIVHSEIMCAGEVLVYSEANSTTVQATYTIPALRYAVDDDGNATMSFSAVQPSPSSVNAYWTAFCGALAGTGGELGGGSADSNYVKLSDVVISMNFSGDDKGIWEDRCLINYQQDNAVLEHGNGTLLLRPYEYLYSK